MQEFATDRPLGGAYGIVMLLVVVPPHHITGTSIRSLVTGGVPPSKALKYRRLYVDATKGLRQRAKQHVN